MIAQDPTQCPERRMIQWLEYETVPEIKDIEFLEQETEYDNNR